MDQIKKLLKRFQCWRLSKFHRKSFGVFGRKTNFSIARSAKIIIIEHFRFGAKSCGGEPISNKVVGSSFVIGKNARVVLNKCWFYSGATLVVKPSAQLEIGKEVGFNDGAYLEASKSIIIGDDVVFGHDVEIRDSDGHSIGQKTQSSPIVIGNHVFVGSKSIVLKGVHIGDGAVIAAGSIVNKDVLPHTMVGGNPARFLRNVPENIKYLVS